MTARPTNKPRKFRGYAVIERADGPLVWGTFRRTEEEARAAFERWNPPLEDFPHAARVLPVEILLLDEK
jgi:hypothetical protein